MDSKHIDDEKIELYILKKVMKEDVETDGDFSEIEGHLSECDRCAKRAHQLLKQFSLLFNYDVFIDNTVLLKQQMRQQIEETIEETDDQTIKKRLQKWWNEFHKHTTLAVKMMMNMPVKGRKLTRVILEDMWKNNVSEGLNLDYAALPLPGRHYEDDQLICMNRVGGYYGELKTNISVIQSEKRLIVEFEASDLQEPPLLFLVSTNVKIKPRIGRAERNLKENRWEIIMDNLDDGTYYTFFEPFDGE
ncbi:MAG TPA: hypothetical protein PK466_11555 [Thermotogota bacterium]|nr:hypothetical protein [Thermotogota bacterium]